MTAKPGVEPNANAHEREIEVMRVMMMSLSVEERLRHVRECCRLLADLFNIQAEAAYLACEVSLSTDAYNALTTICRTSAEDLERLVREMPPSLANWHGEAMVDRL